MTQDFDLKHARNAWGEICIWMGVTGVVSSAALTFILPRHRHLAGLRDYQGSIAKEGLGYSRAMRKMKHSVPPQIPNRSTVQGFFCEHFCGIRRDNGLKRIEKAIP